MTGIHFFKVTGLILTTIEFAFVSGQTPSIEWQRSYGGSSNDFATSILQTKDGGYAFAGADNSNDGDVLGNKGYSDVWVVKLKPDGTISWQQSLGGSYIEAAYSMVQTFDDGFVIAGNSASNDSDVSGNHGNFDYWIVKLDSIGNIQWQKCLGGIYSDYVSSIIQTSDSGYAVTGIAGANSGDITNNHGGEDYWVAKLDASGNIEWENSYGGSDDDEVASIIETSDDGFVMVGNTRSNDGNVSGNHGTQDCWVVKIDSVGEIQWQKCYGGSLGDAGSSIKLTADSGFAIAGSAVSNDSDIIGNHGMSDVWFIKLDRNGNLKWQKCYGGSADDFALSFDFAANDGYVIGASTASPDDDVTGYHDLYSAYRDYWVIRIDSVGNLLWQKCLGGNLDDYVYSISATDDNGCIVTGYSYSTDGDISGNHGGDDAWVVKLSNETGISELQAEQNSFLFPNPATSLISFTSIKQPYSIIIRDCEGRIVQQNFMSISDKSIDISTLPNGIYFLELIDSSKNRIGKFVKQ